MSLVSRTLIAVLVCGLFAAVPFTASATTIGAPQNGATQCAWGYATTDDPAAWAFGEVITAPASTGDVLDSYTFWVAQEIAGEARTITYKAYVAEWDPTNGPDGGPGTQLWESGAQTFTTSADPAQQAIKTDTGGLQLVGGHQYIVYLSTQETMGSLAPGDRGCWAAGTFYADGAFAVQGPFVTTSWMSPLATTGEDTAFSATFSSSTRYAFAGFYAPVNNNALNQVRAGSAIPVRFSLGGNQGLDIFDAGYPRSEGIACGSQQVDGIEQTVQPGASDLTYAAGSDTYTYVWKTDKAWADSCRQLVLRFDDGTVKRVNFSFTK